VDETGPALQQPSEAGEIPADVTPVDGALGDEAPVDGALGDEAPADEDLAV